MAAPADLRLVEKEKGESEVVRLQPTARQIPGWRRPLPEMLPLWRTGKKPSKVRPELLDDAIARLYRAVESFAQNHLHRAFGAASGRIPLDSLDPSLADRLRNAFPDERIDDGNGSRLQLSCAKAFAALAYSPFKDDHVLPEAYDRLKGALAKRNESWLAHGTRPASASDFDQMWKLVLNELGIAAESLPDWPNIDFTE